MFQGYINDTLKDLLDMTCVAYMDDIIIFLSNRVDHVCHMREVLTQLHKYSLYVKLSKYEFDTTKLAFLGYQISTIGISMDP